MQFIHTGGTLDLSADYRTLDVSNNAEEIDATAGGDVYKNTLAGPIDGKATLETLATTDGTVAWDALTPGAAGTLQWSPEGTATGMQKKAAPALVLNRGEKVGYNTAVTLTAEFRITNAITVESW